MTTDEFTSSKYPYPITFDSEIEELELSIRIQNCLRVAEIERVRHLVSMSEIDLLRLPNFGRKSLLELKEFLAAYSLRLGMDVPLPSIYTEQLFINQDYT